jgi:serine/threonine protein phosphatase PrpC
MGMVYIGRSIYLFFSIAYKNVGSEGGKASSYVKSIFPEVLLSKKAAFESDPIAAIKSVYSSVNNRLIENPAIDTYMSGTTAVILIYLEDERKVVVANVGDSRVLLGRKTEGENSYIGVQLTT